jgi:hypothetical protein
MNPPICCDQSVHREIESFIHVILSSRFLLCDFIINNPLKKIGDAPLSS